MERHNGCSHAVCGTVEGSRTVCLRRCGGNKTEPKFTHARFEVVIGCSYKFKFEDMTCNFQLKCIQMSAATLCQEN